VDLVSQHDKSSTPNDGLRGSGRASCCAPAAASTGVMRFFANHGALDHIVIGG
jgi:hypothetical protein